MDTFGDGFKILALSKLVGSPLQFQNKSFLTLELSGCADIFVSQQISQTDVSGQLKWLCPPVATAGSYENGHNMRSLASLILR